MKLDFPTAQSLVETLPAGPAPLSAHAKSPDALFPPQTILLIEDQRIIREHMAACLENLGYNVLSAGDSAGALSIMRQFRGRIDLLLTDFSMPGISGPELSRLAAQERPGIKVLYMSSYPEEMVWQSEFSRQRPAWLAKPFTAQLLANGVEKALGSAGRFVLIVDEDREVRDFLGTALRRNGYEIFEAGGFNAAREILNARRVQLIIGDLSRFEHKGEESIRNFRRLYPGTKILVMTGDLPAISKNPPFVRRRSRRPMEKEDLKARWLRGAHATLPKPVSTDLLLDTVSKIFED